MAFLPDVYVPCEVCGGARFNAETLAVRYKGKTIADVLALTFAEAAVLLGHPAHPPRRAVRLRHRPGLPATGPAQPHPVRRRSPAHQAGPRDGPAGAGHTLYILDEPTTGLHLADVQRCWTSSRGWSTRATAWW
jgi:excinuclease ABC subunit A